MSRVDLGERELEVLDQGSGLPVLLVHGFPLDHTMWRFQIDALAESYRVIAPDLRGFGSSPIDSAAAQCGVAMEEYADDLAKLLDALDLSEPVVICGFSMGGYVALQFLRRHGSRLGGLVLIDSKAAADTDRARAMRIKMAENVESWGSAHVAKLMTSKMYAASTPASRPEIVAEFIAIVSRTNPASIAAAQRGMAARPDSMQLLELLKLPTLYVVGEEDQISLPAEMKAMAEQTPGSTLAEIPDAGHMSPMENPAGVNKELLEFLDRLSG